MSSIKEILTRTRGLVATPAQAAEALRRIEAARYRLILDQPFFGVLASRLALVARPEVGTMATDGISLFYNPLFVLEVSDAELLGIWAHEVSHCSLGHMKRIQNRDMGEANIAADLSINPDLIRLGFALPSDVWNDPTFANMGFEEIYSARAQAKRKEDEKQAAENGDKGEPGQPGAEGEPGKGDAGEPGQPGNGTGEATGAAQNAGDTGEATGDAAEAGDAGKGQPGAGKGQPGTGQGQPGKGEASGDAGDVNGMGGILKPGEASQAEIDEVAENWQIWTRQAVATVGKAGDLPGFFKRIIAEISADVEGDLVAALADFINSKVATDYSFSRPNRRLISSGFYLPGTIVDGLEHLLFAVDSSGSIDAHMMNIAAAKIVDAMDSGKVERCTVIFADTHVRKVQTFERGDDIRATLDARGGGGTRFDKTFEWIAEHASDATACIYLTDMECDHFGIEPDNMPVLWAIHGDSRKFEAFAARAPFGQSVYVGRLE